MLRPFNFYKSQKKKKSGKGEVYDLKGKVRDEGQ